MNTKMKTTFTTTYFFFGYFYGDSKRILLQK